MKVSCYIFVFGLAAATQSAATAEEGNNDINVVNIDGGGRISVYDGPKECNDADRVGVGDLVAIHYTGRIDSSSSSGEAAKVFDSSIDRGAPPPEVTVGVGDLIQGWDAGLLGLCRGAEAILVVPPHMGYGDTGVGDVIPGGATLNFDINVISVTKPPPQPDLFEELDTDRDGLLSTDEIHVHFRKNSDDAPLPPHLMEQTDVNRDGFVSRDEFGGPRMPWDMCLEMLHRNPESTELGLTVRWVCQRPRGSGGIDADINADAERKTDHSKETVPMETSPTSRDDSGEL